MSGNVSRFPWSSVTNPTSEQLREANDWEHLLAAREAIRLIAGSVREAADSVLSRAGQNALSDVRAWLEQSDEELTRALSACGYVEHVRENA